MSVKTRRVPARPAPTSPGPPKFACATFDFTPSVNEELQLDVGDVVRIIHKVDDFWIFGQKIHTGEKGQFPSDFVRQIILPKHSPTETLLYALDTFFPEAEGDLPFNKGDIIILEKKINGEWGSGRCSDFSKRGIFPLNYTDLLVNPKSKSDPLSKDIKTIANGVPNQTDASAGNKGLMKVKAIMNLTAQLEEELSFAIGDEITIIEEMDNGTWYKGRLGNDVGTFPAAFVQPLTPIENPAVISETSRSLTKQSLSTTGRNSWNKEPFDRIENSKTNSSTVVDTDADANFKKVHLGNGAMKNQPNISNNIKGSSCVGTTKEDSEKSSTQETTLYTVTAIHQYTKNTDQELSFEVGAIIPIYEEIDQHWLFGQVGTKKGYIARAYITQTCDTEKAGMNSKTKGNRVVSKTDDRERKTNGDQLGFVKKTRETLINKNHVYSGPDSSSQSETSRSKKEKKTHSIREACAIFDYHASKRFDLTIVAGEFLSVVKDVDHNWVEVKNKSGKKGIVPNTFIQYIEDMPPEKKSDESKIAKQPEFHKDDTMSHVSNEACVDNDNVRYPLNEPTMPVLHENTVQSSVQIERHQVPVYSSSQRPRKPSSLPIPEPESLPSSSLKKSISVDSYVTTLPNRNSAVNRSNSNPQKTVTAQDARQILIAWCATRRTSTPTTPASSQNDNSETSSTSSEATVSRKSSFARGSSRSMSMREKRTRRKKPEATSKDTSFLKIRSDSDLTNQPSLRQHRHKTVTGVMSYPHYDNDRKSNRRSSPVKAKHADSLSIASTGSSSSHGEVKNTRSGNSDFSDTHSRSSTSSRKSTYRPAPPIPPHGSDAISVSDNSSYQSHDSSPWTPPVPSRSQSLQHSAATPTVDTPPPPPDVSLIPTRSSSYTPARPAPQLPASTKLSISGESSPKKKVPPMRPVNPPRSRKSPSKSKSAGSQERVRRVTSKGVKSRIEKIRSDIEDYSRMKTDLESLYQSTLDGRERKDISENMEFVKANLRRLQKEFHNLIDGQQDHIYESVEQYMERCPTNETATDNDGLTSPPPLPVVPNSPGSVRLKRMERRLRVISELVDTERIFLNDVTITVEDIMNELIDRQISQNTISILFANILQVKEFSEKLFIQLVEALQNESSEQPNSEGPTIGQVFIDCNLEMKEIYTPYYRNHDDAMTHLEMKMKEDHEFAQIVQQCLESVKSKVNVFDLGSFLIKPVQRFLKYPLLIEEIIKLTDKSTPDCPTDQDKLILAHKLMQTIAKEINEDKRIKDLVRKYKGAGNEGISEKLSKLNLKSIKKKSTRISKKLGMVTGITTQETRDPQFDEVEKRFKITERAIKLFIYNVTLYCDKCRDVLCAELTVANAMVEVVVHPENAHPVARFKTIADKMADQLYRQFHDQVQLQVVSPITTLVYSFKSPQAIIDKRKDKLIDYESLLKHSDSKEKIEAAKHDYEALNKSLLDELPKLCDLSLKLLTSCIAIFSRVHRDFENKLLQEMDPLLCMIQQSSDGVNKYSNNFEIFDKFRPDYMEAIHTLSALQVVPASFGAIFANTSRSDSRSSTSRSSPQKRWDNNSTLKQPVDDRQLLLKKYDPQQLFVATRNYNASQVADISCCEGDLVSVLKQNDPMGSRERWFVDRGGPGSSTGFLPASILKTFDASSECGILSTNTASAYSPSPTHRKSLSVENSPLPAVRSLSPNPSLKSHSSEGSGSPATRRTSVSPHTVREKLKSGNMLSKNDGTPYTEEDLMDAFEEEGELLEDIYGDASYPEPSPRSAKQHFRAEYDFNARSDIELSLKIGNIVSLIVAHDSDGNPDWWFVGNADGRQGYVPANYLTKAEYL